MLKVESSTFSLELLGVGPCAHTGVPEIRGLNIDPKSYWNSCTNNNITRAIVNTKQY